MFSVFSVFAQFLVDVLRVQSNKVLWGTPTRGTYMYAPTYKYASI